MASMVQASKGETTQRSECCQSEIYVPHTSPVRGIQKLSAAVYYQQIFYFAKRFVTLDAGLIHLLLKY